MRNAPRRAEQESLAFPDDPAPSIVHIRAETLAKIDRLRPPVKAHDGKYYLARRIVPILLGVRERITEYLEPCAFGASVFLAMPRAEREILGDINPAVCAMWTVLGNELLASALTDRLSRLSYDEATFDAARAPSDGTLLDQAAIPRHLSFLARWTWNGIRMVGTNEGRKTWRRERLGHVSA